MVGPAREYSSVGDNEIFSEWFAVDDWQSSSAAATELLTLAAKLSSTTVVLDDYRVDETFQLLLRERGLRWLQFDGTAKKPLWANWILNSSPTARSEDYQEVKRNPEAKMLLGPSYAVLRSGFREMAMRPCGRPIRRVLLTFGGGDDRGAIEWVLSALLNQTGPDIRFLVVSGRANPRNNNLMEWIDLYGAGKVEIKIDPPDIPRVFASCDFAIMAGGSSTYEAACCKVPMLLISIAENQRRHCEAWEEIGAAIYLGDLSSPSEAKLRNLFGHVSASIEKRTELCVAAHSICDGRGAVRVADTLLS